MERPYDAATCRKRLREVSLSPDIKPVPQGLRGAILGTINALFDSDKKGNADEKRHTVLGWIFGEPCQPIKPLSSKQLTDGQWYALSRWVDLSRTVDNHWLPTQYFMTEALFVLHASIQQRLKEEEQMLMSLQFEEIPDGS